MTLVRRGNSIGVLVYDPTVKGKVWVGTCYTEEAAKTLEARESARRKLKVPRETCDSFARRWTYDYPRPAHNTNETRRYALRRFIRDFEGVPLHSVPRTRARAWALEQPAGTTDAVRVMFNDALNDGLVSENPFTNLRRRRSRGRRDLEVIKEDEIHHLASLAEKAWGEFGRLVFGPLIIVYTYLLIRPAELAFIERSDVLWDTGEVLVLDSDDGRGLPKLPKNDNKRKIILPPPAAEAARLVPPRIDVPWLFYTQTGRRFNKSSFNYYWNPVRVLFGRPGMDFYELKHAGCSHYVNELELDPQDVAVQAGHQDGGYRIRTLYGHPEEKRARERMQEAFRNRIKYPEEQL